MKACPEQAKGESMPRASKWWKMKVCRGKVSGETCQYVPLKWWKLKYAQTKVSGENLVFPGKVNGIKFR